MFAGSVTGGIPASGTDRSDRELVTCQEAGLGEARACWGGAAARCGAGAVAPWSLSAAGRRAIVTTAAAAAAIKARPPNQAQRLALGPACRPIALIAILTVVLVPYPARRCRPSCGQHLGQGNGAQAAPGQAAQDGGQGGHGAGVPKVQADDRPGPRLAEHGGHDGVRPRIGVVERVHVVGDAGLVSGPAGRPLDQRRRIPRLRGPEPAADRPGQGAQPLGAALDLRIGARGVHGRDVQVMHGVIAQVVAAAHDPLRHRRVLLEPGPDGEYRDPRSRALGLGEQRVGHRHGTLTVEGERHLRPLPRAVHDLRAQSRAGAAGRAHPRRRPGRSTRTAAVGGVRGPRAGAPGQRRPGGDRAGKEQEVSPLNRHAQKSTHPRPASPPSYRSLSCSPCWAILPLTNQMNSFLITAMGRISGVSAADTRARLLRAAADVFGERGYDGTRVADIAATAGVSNGALYAHFTSKAELLVAALRTHGRRLLADALAADPDRSITDLLVLIGRWLPRRRDASGHLLVQALVAARRDEDVARPMRDYVGERAAWIAGLVRVAPADGELDPAPAPNALAHFCLLLPMGSALITPVLHPVGDDEWGALITLVAGALDP